LLSGPTRFNVAFGPRPLARLGLGVLPALKNKFAAVVVGVEHVACIVARIVIEPGTWFAIVGRVGRLQNQLQVYGNCLGPVSKALKFRVKLAVLGRGIR
jgi:hypothetical protein